MLTVHIGSPERPVAMKPNALHTRPRRLGASQLEIPPFGFGGAHLGELFARLPEKQSEDTMEAAWAAGVRYYDTAPWYGHGLSEQRVGWLLRRMPRDEFVLSTKVGRVYLPPKDMAAYSSAPWTGGLPFEPHFDYTYDGVMRSYEQSLMRLGLNRIDALTIHDLDRGYHADDATFETHWRKLEAGGFRALKELKVAGDIGAIGAGNNQADLIERFATQLDLDYVLVAMPYTLLDQFVAAPGGGFDVCARRNVSVIIGSPFASGILADPDANKVYGYEPAKRPILEKVAKIVAVCRAHGVALPAAALQFVLAHPLVASVIPGAVSAQQVRDNAAHVATRLPAAFWAELRDKRLIHPSAPVPGDT